MTAARPSAADPAGPAVELREADCGYPGARTPALRRATLVVEPGGFVGAVGPSGSGKTTLIRALTGRCRVWHGAVRVFGRPVRPHRPSREVGYVPQVGTVDASFPITVEQVTLQGLAGRGLPWPTRAERRTVAALLERLGLTALAGRAIGDLSGGELQRAFLARALVRRPRLLLLDEPTSGVDLKTRHDVLHLLADLNAEGITVLLTTHDLNFVAAHLPRVVCLAGRVVADGTPEQVLRPDVLHATYGAEVRIIRDGELVFVADPTHLLSRHRPATGPAPGPGPGNAPGAVRDGAGAGSGGPPGGVPHGAPEAGTEGAPGTAPGDAPGVAQDGTSDRTSDGTRDGAPGEAPARR